MTREEGTGGYTGGVSGACGAEAGASRMRKAPVSAIFFVSLKSLLSLMSLPFWEMGPSAEQAPNTMPLEDRPAFGQRRQVQWPG